MANPGQDLHSRVVVFCGSGHAFLQCQCVTGTPGLRLVAANDFLPP